MIVSPSTHGVRINAIGAEDRGVRAHLLEIRAGAREAAVLVGACADVVRLSCRVAGIPEDEHGCNYDRNISYVLYPTKVLQARLKLAETVSQQRVSSQTRINLRWLPGLVSAESNPSTSGSVVWYMVESPPVPTNMSLTTCAPRLYPVSTSLESGQSCA